MKIVNESPRTPPAEATTELLGLLEVLRHSTRSATNATRLDRAHNLAEVLIADLSSTRAAREKAESRVAEIEKDREWWVKRADTLADEREARKQAEARVAESEQGEER